MKKYKDIFLRILFNIVEISILVLLGELLNIDMQFTLYIIIVFSLSRNILGRKIHYKKWQLCFLWSTLIFLSLFVLIKVDLALSIIFTIFAGFILTGKANADLFLWKGKTTKYQDIVEYIKYHPLADDLVQFEENIKKQDDLTYLIYKYRFKDELSFSEISEKLQIDTQRITEYLDKIAFAIRLYCKI